MTCAGAPAATGGQKGMRLSRRVIQSALMVEFPALTRSKAARIAERHSCLSEGRAEALRHLIDAGLPARAYRGSDPTGELAVSRVIGGLA